MVADLRPMQRVDGLRHPGLVPAQIAWQVEEQGREDAGAAFRQPVRQLVAGADDSPFLEHLVADQRGHLFPLTLAGQAVQLAADVEPAVELEHGVIGRGGSVKRDVLLQRAPGRSDTLPVPGDGEERCADQVELGGIAPGLIGARRDGRQ